MIDIIIFLCYYKIPCALGGNMSFIRKFIIKNQLGKELKEIENELSKTGYYQKERELDLLTYLPDDYAKLYVQIHEEYGDLLQKRKDVSTQLHSLSGPNLFKQHDTEYIK